MNIKPRIRLVENELIVETSFDNGWINAIKACVPIASRHWDPARFWRFKPAYYQCVLEITRRFFGDDILDSTGGVGHPQDMAWKQKLENHEANRAGRAAMPIPDLPKSPRAILFVTDDAPDYVIKAAYGVLIKRAHPDAGGNEAAAQRINAAYEKLKNG